MFPVCCFMRLAVWSLCCCCFFVFFSHPIFNSKMGFKWQELSHL